MLGFLPGHHALLSVDLVDIFYSFNVRRMIQMAYLDVVSLGIDLRQVRELSRAFLRLLRGQQWRTITFSAAGVS